MQIFADTYCVIIFYKFKIQPKLFTSEEEENGIDKNIVVSIKSASPRLSSVKKWCKMGNETDIFDTFI